MITKKCSRCGEIKSLKYFQKRSASKDGHTASCKKCLSEYDKKRASLPHRVEARKKYSKTEAGIKAGSKAKKKYIEKNKKKRSAHISVGNAIRDGRLLVLPCEDCFNTHDIHAHHDDYDKPLDVRWLCAKCHKKWHENNGEGINGKENTKS